MSDALKKLTFDSYNAMSRPAMFMSIPIMPLMGLVLCGLATGAGVTALLNWIWGLVAAFPFVLALILLRIVGLIDPRYLRRIRFACRRLWWNHRIGRPALLTPFNPRWSALYAARFSQQRHADRRDGAGDAVSRH